MSRDREHRRESKKGRAGRKPISVRESSGYLVADSGDPKPPQPSRRVSVEDETWIVRLAGQGAGGAGKMVALRFYREDEPDTPPRELLTGAIDLANLHPDELRELYARAESSGANEDGKSMD